MTQGASPVDLADLAIVGGGPSALRALAELDSLLAADERQPGQPPAASARGRVPRIVVIERAEPGAGAVWETNQPQHLILNASSSIVDLSCVQVPLSYQQWAGQEADSYPSRARVGGYLAWAFARLQESPRWTLEVRPGWVDAVAPGGGFYELRLSASREDPVTPGGGAMLAREVLFCTGHAPSTVPDHGALSAPDPHAAPTQDASIHDAPAPGSPCVLRGAALTAFDVIADLTVGRGGEYTTTADGRLGYLRSGAEPSSVQMWSRSGEMMLPKPLAPTPGLAEAVLAHTRLLRQGAHPDDAWWRRLRDAAVAAAAAAGVQLAPESLDAVWQKTETSPSAVESRDITEASLRRWRTDLGRAGGAVDADPRWWWGRAWAAGYDDVVRSLDRAERERSTWNRFRTRAALLEKWAFGPPPQTVQRLVALCETGLLSVHRGTPPSGTEAPECTIDAITPGPGVLRRPAPWAPPPVDAAQPAQSAALDAVWSAPWDGLLALGLATVRAGERGVLTTPTGRLVGRDGLPVQALSALGRPTEDPTIGHDSLQRGLRPEFAAWAQAWVATWRAATGSRLEQTPAVPHSEQGA